MFARWNPKNQNRVGTDQIITIMSMSASCEIVNNTGKVIVFTNISQVNDDATWSINPPVGSKIQNGESCLISMGNSSVIFAPRGVGFNAVFVDADLDTGQVYLDDPAVGAHHFQFGGNFQFADSNPNGNSYVVEVSPA